MVETVIWTQESSQIERYRPMVPEDPAVNWLLESEDPSVRYLTLTEILDRPSDSKEVLVAKKQIPNGPVVKTLLSGQRADGGFGVHPYQKWRGAHWRLVSLVELGIPSGFRARRERRDASPRPSISRRDGPRNPRQLVEMERRAL